MQRQYRVILPLPAAPRPRSAAIGARGAGAVLLFLVGLFHLLTARYHFEEAPYLGILFWLTTAGTWAACLGVAAGGRGAWIIGALICAATFAGLLIALTVGLPRFSEEPGAAYVVPSLVVEGLFLGLYAVSAAARRDPAGT